MTTDIEVMIVELYAVSEPIIPTPFRAGGPDTIDP
jgi:hypothetical protein